MLPRMRTIKELALLVKQKDPETKLTERAIRSLAKSGKLPSVQVGSKYLISIESFEEFLKGNIPTIEEKKTEHICIKPIRQYQI